MIARYFLNEELQDEDADAEASIYAFKHKGRYEKQEPELRKSQWWRSANASKRAKEALEHAKLKKKLDEEKADVKVKALRHTLSTAFARNVLPPRNDERESCYTESEDEGEFNPPKQGKEISKVVLEPHQTEAKDRRTSTTEKRTIPTLKSSKLLKRQPEVQVIEVH